jgi:hypothetical protein
MNFKLFSEKHNKGLEIYNLKLIKMDQLNNGWSNSTGDISSTNIFTISTGSQIRFH